MHIRNRYFFLFDCLLLTGAPGFALLFRVDAEEAFGILLRPLIIFTAMALLIKLPIFLRAGLYSRYWRYASVEELGQITLAVSIAAFILNPLFYFIVGPVVHFAESLPRSISLLDFLLTLFVVGGSRFALRLADHYRGRSLDTRNQRLVLVIGAGHTGRMIVREMQSKPQLGLKPVGFIDDDKSKHGLHIQGVAVFGGRARLKELMRDIPVAQAIIAMPTAPGKLIREIVRDCEQANLPVRIVPSLTEILNNHVSISQIRNVQLEDLLRRDPIQIDTTAVRNTIAGRKVLVTGAGGSIGSELCRQIAQYAPAELILLGHGEYSIFMLAAEFARIHPRLPITRVIADVRDGPRIHHVVAAFRPDIIFHAAAHKHVPLMEENLEDAISNNVLGTRVVVDAAVAHGVNSLVLVSTDKAVNPTSVMGVSKRIAELIVTDAAHGHGRCFVGVRFGNVLGSRGSVLNVFRDQIARGGPVTITHPEMRRYFMTIPEAVMLVLQAMTLGKGGETFVLDMGEPIKIAEMARDLVELSGLQVGRDVDIEFTGTRPGEKLFEELFLEADHYERTQHNKIFVSRNGVAALKTTRNGAAALTFDERVQALMAAVGAGEHEHILYCLKDLVPEYRYESAPTVLAHVGGQVVALPV